MEPAPVDIEIAPPVVSDVVPADTTISPPTPASADPTDTVMVPAFPTPLALPVLTFNNPELPELVVPVENESEPLIPATPALTL